MKVLGGIKLSMPAVDLMVHAVEGVKFLCEEVGVAHKESEGKTVHLTPQGMDVGVVYTASDCVEMLLGYLPLYKDLFSLVIATFRKIQAHVGGGGGGRREREGGGRRGEGGGNRGRSERGVGEKIEGAGWEERWRGSNRRSGDLIFIIFPGLVLKWFISF